MVPVTAGAGAVGEGEGGEVRGGHDDGAPVETGDDRFKTSPQGHTSGKHLPELDIREDARHARHLDLLGGRGGGGPDGERVGAVGAEGGAGDDPAALGDPVPGPVPVMGDPGADEAAPVHLQHEVPGLDPGHVVVGCSVAGGDAEAGAGQRLGGHGGGGGALVLAARVERGAEHGGLALRVEAALLVERDDAGLPVLVPQFGGAVLGQGVVSHGVLLRVLG
ncbi:hypothetical protein UN64_19520 [Fictibacillus arsenicus]|uniref:Uncharacterized protein n=1 Tax=Fictibacillus arsenicus TaxID=255247 RepID=A0A1V3FZH6_9BACL|nr:hypothetical protein UN64_19520 [Fictibacillus arsenicus]